MLNVAIVISYQDFILGVDMTFLHYEKKIFKCITVVFH